MGSIISSKGTGVTLVLTTHFMDEAEQLCDRLVVMDNGAIMAKGSPSGLIKQYSSKEVLEVRFGSDRNKEVAPQLATMCERMETLPDRVLMYTEDGEALLEQIMRQSCTQLPLLVRRSSLEDVFLRLTGRTLIE
jgi:lipooligosaccharide transport system ATP-binding protein